MYDGDNPLHLLSSCYTMHSDQTPEQMTSGLPVSLLAQLACSLGAVLQLKSSCFMLCIVLARPKTEGNFNLHLSEARKLPVPTAARLQSSWRTGLWSCAALKRSVAFRGWAETRGDLQGLNPT